MNLIASSIAWQRILSLWARKTLSCQGLGVLLLTRRWVHWPSDGGGEANKHLCAQMGHLSPALLPVCLICVALLWSCLSFEFSCVPELCQEAQFTQLGPGPLSALDFRLVSPGPVYVPFIVVLQGLPVSDVQGLRGLPCEQIAGPPCYWTDSVLPCYQMLCQLQPLLPLRMAWN